ncbi:MAG TPA: hypothetical protein VHT52_22105 [Stellaceae bacterium]|jgi:hypothetical protein|nr:hypothetical protein [Stellaceae bacterium]
MMHFLGICRGGPRDNDWLDWHRDEYVMPFLQPSTAKLFSGEEPLGVAKVTYGRYRHVLGQWIWQPDADHKDVRLRRV